MRYRRIPFYNQIDMGLYPQYRHHRKPKESTLTKILSVIAVILLCIVILFGICKLTGICKEKFINNANSNDPKLQELKTLITPLFTDPNKVFTGRLESLNDRDILSEINLYVGRKSYTINKKNVYMCLKDEKGNYYDNNSLLHVLLHELSHVINQGIGHGDDFQETFNELIEWSVEKGVYNPNVPMVANYCPGPEEV
jgi:hypothetical protein